MFAEILLFCYKYINTFYYVLKYKGIRFKGSKYLQNIFMGIFQSKNKFSPKVK